MNPVTATNGEVKEVQAIGHDITDRKRADEIKQGLTHVSRLAVVGELTAMIAHEINQPLGAILSNADAAEMLIERPNPPLGEIAEILRDIHKDDLRASRVVQRVRALLSKREVEMEQIDLTETIVDVVHLVTADARRRHIQIRLTFDRSLPKVVADKVQLQQAFLNLILNAMDAMEKTPVEKRNLFIKTAPFSPGFCEVVIQDCGCGIPPEQLTKIFDSFYTTKKNGMGIGLSIARAVADAHNGQIWAENNAQSDGATFRMALPLAQSPAVKT
jgi:C4-dicarboxylate-specific signal transduction histidine kinase